MRRRKTQTGRSLTATLSLAFFSLSVALLLVYTVLRFYTDLQKEQEIVFNQQQMIAREAGTTVSSFIEGTFSTLETSLKLASNIATSAAAQQQVLSSMMSLQPALRHAVLFDAQGAEVTRVSRLSQTALQEFLDLVGPDLLAEVQQSANYISPVYVDEFTSEPLVLMAVSTYDVFGDFQGVLVTEVNLKFIWDLVDQIRVGETGLAYVVDRRGQLIAFRDTARVLRGENLSGLPAVESFLGNLADVGVTATFYEGIDGATSVGTYVALGTPDWAVVTEMPVREAFGPFVNTTVTSFALILLMAVIAGAVGVYVARRLSAPLLDLTNTATRIAEGEIGLEARVTGASEVVQLADAFNSMTGQLRELIDSLERRVKQRTEALAASMEVSRHLSTILDETELVNAIVEQVRDAFAYYHTQVYLFDDPGEYLVMVGGTGEAGRQMLASGHRIAQGQGLVGRAAASAAPVLVVDVSQAQDWLPNPLLPETKAETAVPIAIGQTILGVMDVQHNVVGGLQQEDVELLQSIANQIAIALRNAQLYAEAEKRGQREAQIRAINESILSTEDETVALQVADMELAHAWGTKRRVVRLIGTENSADGAAAAVVEDALLRLPIRIGSEVIGELVITEDVNDPAEARGIAFVVAQQLGQHLEKLRLSATARQALADAQRRGRELAVLNNIVTNLSAATSLQESMQIVVDEVAAAVRVRQARIALFNEAADQLTIVAEHYDAAHAPSALGQSIPLAGNLLTEQVVQTRQACYVPDARTSSLTQSFQEILLTQGILGLAVIPIVIADQVAGTLGIDILDGDKSLSTEQLQLAEAIVLQAATAIEKARLFEQTEARAEELAVINEVAEIVSRQITQQDLLLTVHEQIRRIMPVDAYFVALHDEEAGMVEFPLVYDNGRVYQEPLSPFNPNGNIAKVIATDQALLINRTPEEIDKVMVGQASAMIGDQQKPSASLLYVPLRIGQEMLGVLSVQSYQFNAYTPTNTTLLLGIANHVAVALDNARLLEESRKTARRAQLLRDISGSINTTLDAESILQTAVREIGRTLGLQTSVYLQDPDANGHQSLPAAQEEPQPA